MSAILDGKRITLGTCYYPEQWTEEMWDDDLCRMKKAGLETIRIGEFAWSKVEEREGEFCYDFFDVFLDMAEKAGMNVIFGTPTATPPAWLTHKYPEVLNATKDGLLYHHGDRRHYNYNSHKYRELSSRIVQKIAEHYAKRKCIIGWQIDNEINCQLNEFYSDSDSAAFRLFLRKKYDTLEALNAAWGTAFWNQGYTDWEEVDVPRRVPHAANNPHQVLDYKRFISFSARSFVKMQSDILRRYIKEGDFITTNGMFSNLDSHLMTRESLTFFMYDSYPNFAYALCEEGGKEIGEWDKDDMHDRKWSEHLARVRSVSFAEKDNAGRFGIMEQQVGANGWIGGIKAPEPRAGQLTLWTMQSIAHGADYIGYYRWRTAAFGTEIYWHGILDYSSRETRRLQEVEAVHKMLQKMDMIAPTHYKAEVGILRDYDNEWDSEADLWHEAVEKASGRALFAALQKTHTPFDYVDMTSLPDVESLAKYKVLFYPHPVIMAESRARLLEEYVKAGGTLVVGCRSGYKDMNGRCIMQEMPGLLCGITGAVVEAHSFIPPDVPRVKIDWDGDDLDASVFIDGLKCTAGGEQAAVYVSSPFGKTQSDCCGDEYGALTAMSVKKSGKGRAYYYGSAWNEESARLFLTRLNVCEPYRDVMAIPPECELAVRSGDNGGGEYAFILNYSGGDVRVHFKRSVSNVLTGGTLQGNVTLMPYGVIVAKL